jgi:multidrug efflux pump subunit AcrA (membrane-fusion protein)
MNKRKIILSVLGLFLILGSIYAASVIIANKKTPKPTPEKVIKTVFVDSVVNTTVPIVVTANGNLRAQRRVELYAEVQGVFKTGQVLFRPGQPFRAGQTIISIEAAEYYASVQSAKSELYNLITSVMPDLRLDYPEVFPKWEAYLREYDINKNLPELPQLVSEKEKYFISGRGILTSYYNIRNLEQRLSKYRIVAPFDGVVTEALVTEGSLVRSGQKLGEFINTGVYELEVAVSKTYSDLLRLGEPVRLVNLDNSKTYTGKVARINGNVDQLSQTIKAFIEVRDPDLKEGMYLEAHLNAKEEGNAIEIDRALLMEGDRIFMVRDTVLDLLEVDPVFFSNRRVVLKKVPEGTVILSKPVVGAYAGMLVKVLWDKTNTGVE